MNFAQGRNLNTVCHYDRLESFNYLRGDLDRLAVGSVCTDVIRLLGRENDPESAAIYALLAETLRRLNDPEQPWQAVSLQFHTDMLRIAGYLPEFTRCLHCESALELEETSHYPFYLALGGFLCRSCHLHSTHAQRVNVSTKTLQLLTSPETPALYGNAVKAHRFLAYYWGTPFGASREKFRFFIPVAGRF